MLLFVVDGVVVVVVVVVVAAVANAIQYSLTIFAEVLG